MVLTTAALGLAIGWHFRPHPDALPKEPADGGEEDEREDEGGEEREPPLAGCRRLGDAGLLREDFLGS